MLLTQQRPCNLPEIMSLLPLTVRGFEDAFANAASEAMGAGGRRRRASMKTKAGGDPASLRAEQLLAAGPDAMALEEAAGEKAGR